MRIRNSVRAGLIALVPIALLHAAMAGNRIATDIAAGAPAPLPDVALATVALRIAIDAALIALGHLALRHFNFGSRAAYGTMGALAAADGYTIALHAGVLTNTPVAGALVTAALLPVLAGAISAFLYAQLAGRDAAAPAPKPRSGTGTSPLQGVIAPAPYDGPVQVRTSFAAGLIAALTPALIATALGAPLVMLTLFEMRTSLGLAAPLAMFVPAVLISFVPCALVVGVTHWIARAFGRTRGLEYAAIAAVLNCAPAFMLTALVAAPLAFPFMMIVGAVMGGVYRRFAGIEPLPLPEDVLATDPAHLVAADHPARRTRTVVIGG